MLEDLGIGFIEDQPILTFKGEMVPEISRCVILFNDECDIQVDVAMYIYEGSRTGVQLEEGSRKLKVTLDGEVLPSHKVTKTLTEAGKLGEVWVQFFLPGSDTNV